MQIADVDSTVTTPTIVCEHSSADLLSFFGPVADFYVYIDSEVRTTIVELGF